MIDIKDKLIKLSEEVVEYLGIMRYVCKEIYKKRI